MKSKKKIALKAVNFPKNSHKIKISIIAIVLLICLLFGTSEILNRNDKFTDIVSPCDYNGQRKANAIVDIGYGERVYIAKTNFYRQLVTVSADTITLQNETNLKNNRYCNDEAKVSGTNDDNLDEGHVIADSLGGVSNAYNITPQNKTLNRSGQQSKMEKEIQKALKSNQKVTNFLAQIYYDNQITMIPSKYKFEYFVGDELKQWEFKNEALK